jgi:probable HAF family extracellular repeat protein
MRSKPGILLAAAYGYAVNDAGQVAGYSHTLGNTIPHAFRCDGSTGGTWQLS